MPNPSPVKGGKLPKARVAYLNCDKPRDKEMRADPVAILPCATKSQAARICRVANMTQQERARLVAKEMQNQYGGYDSSDWLPQACQILAVLGLGGEATR